MSDGSGSIEQQVRRAWRAVEGDGAPAFATTWQAVERRYGARRRHLRFAAAAVLVTAVAVGVKLHTPPADDLRYIEVAELLGSTSWTAPSDVLLPEHEFDIYQELPTLLESTEAAGGSLL